MDPTPIGLLGSSLGSADFGPEAATQDVGVEEDFLLGEGMLKRGLHAEALGKYERYLRRSRRGKYARKAQYRVGVCLEALGRDKDARAALLRALSMRGSFAFEAECRYRLAGLLRKAGNARGAAQEYERLWKLVPRDHYLRASVAFSLGELAADLGKASEALPRFLSAAKADASKDGAIAFPALYRAAALHMAAGEATSARSCLEKALERFPSHRLAEEARFLVAEASFAEGRFAAARASYTKIAESESPFRAPALLGLAWCCRKDGKHEEALRVLGKLGALESTGGLAARAQLLEAETLRSLSRPGEAAKRARRAIDSRELDAATERRARELLANLQLETGKGKDAERSFREALASEKDSLRRADLYFGLADAQAASGNFEGALRSYGEARKAGAKGELLLDLLYGEALAMHQLGRYRASLSKVRGMLKRDLPARLREAARFAEAENLFALKAHRDAEPVYQSLRGSRAYGKEASWKHAWCAFLEGQYEEAQRRFAEIAESFDQKDARAQEALSLLAVSAHEAGNTDAALAAADRYLLRYPKGAQLARTERVASRVLKAKGRLREAAARLQRARGLSGGKDRGALDAVELGNLAYAQGDFEKAERYYGPLTSRKDVIGVRSLLGAAWCDFELGNDARCTKRIEAALGHEKSAEVEAEALELLVSLAQRRKDWDGVRKAVQRYLLRQPRGEKADALRFAAAVAAARSQHWEEARTELASLLKKGAKIGEPGRLAYELAWAERKSGRASASEAAFRKVLAESKDPDLRGEASLHLGVVELTRDRKRGRALLAKVEGRYRSRACYRLGFSLIEDKEYSAAAEAFQEILRLAQSDKLIAEARFLLGECHYMAARYAEARKAFDAALEVAPRHPRATLAMLHRGRSALITGAAEQAERDLATWRAHADKSTSRSDRARASLWLGLARMQRKRFASACKDFDVVTRLSKGNLAAEAQFRIGEARRAMGKMKEAAEAFVTLGILYSQEEWVRRALLEAGQCYEAMGQGDKAKRLYEELLQRFKASKEAHAARTRLQAMRR